MQLEILQDNFWKAISLCLRFISSKPQLPILSHLLLKVEEGQFTLTASNLENTLHLPVGAKAIQDGVFAVPARPLADIVSSLTGKIALHTTTSQLELTTPSFSAKVNGTPASEFPRLTNYDVSSATVWELSRKELASAVSKTSFCTALDENRPVLTGVLFRSQDKGLILAATDGFRLSKVSLPLGSKTSSPLTTAVLPARTLTEVAKILSEGQADTVKLLFLPDNQVLFELDSLKILSRLISGNFPDFEKIIPSNEGTKVRLNSDDFSKAIRLSSVFAKESANIVRLKIDGTTLSISAASAQVGENVSTLEVTIEGKEDLKNFQIAFNYRYLLDFLGSLDKSGEVEMELTTSLAPGLFRFVGNSHYLHLIMPVRVQS